MRRFLVLLVVLHVILCGLVVAQSGPFLASTPESSKDGVQVFIGEDSAGVRELKVYVHAGGNTNGRKPETVYSEELKVHVYDDAGKELLLTTSPFSGDTGRLMGVCNAGSCSAIKIYNFSVPKADTDRVRKVFLTFRNKPYELTMEKYPPIKPAR